MSDDMLYVVLDLGDVSSRGFVTVQGVYADEDDAERRREEVNSPYKNVRVMMTAFHDVEEDDGGT